MRIIVDVMGGDNAPDAIALGAIRQRPLPRGSGLTGAAARSMHACRLSRSFLSAD